MCRTSARLSRAWSAGATAAWWPSVCSASTDAELRVAGQGYRPGMVRADLPDEQRRQRLRDGEGADASRRASEAEAGADGSFARGGALPSAAITESCKVQHMMGG